MTVTRRGKEALKERMLLTTNILEVQFNDNCALKMMQTHTRAYSRATCR